MLGAGKISMKKLLYLYLLLSAGCIPFFGESHDPQFVQIDFRYGNGDRIDTFSGILVKDLIPGTASTNFWFTKQEQEMILAKVDSLGFFSLPDTIDITPHIIIQPGWGPYHYRIKCGSRDKTVVLYDYSIESEKMPEIGRRITKLIEFIIELAYSKSEYKSLPETKGLYL